MSFTKLDDLGRKLEALEHAQSMLSVDEAVQMPTGGGDKRAEAMAMLAGMYHEMAAAPEIAEWIATARTEPLSDTKKTALNEFERNYINLTCLSSDFVRRQVSARVRSEQLWRELRPAGNWKDFLPAFEGIVNLAREEAQLRSQVLKLAPYDALIEQYDPGSRVSDIAPVFTELKTFLKTFIPKALAAQAERRAKHPAKPFNAPYPIEKQKALGEAMMFRTIPFAAACPPTCA
jgi:carboxypeptidase Taq